MTSYDLNIRQEEYKELYDQKIIKRIPIIISVNGCKFSKLLKDVPKPFCKRTSKAISCAVLETVRQIDPAVMAYIYSDRVSFILWSSNENKESWLNNSVQRLSSRISSMMTYNFNNYINTAESPPNISSPALFDCMTFGVPNIAELINNLVCRQQEYKTKAVQEACFAEIGRKHGRQEAFSMVKDKSTIDRILLLQSECGIDYDTYPHSFRLGSLVYKAPKIINTPSGEETATKWYLDETIVDFLDNRKRLANIFYTGSDIFRPKRDL